MGLGAKPMRGGAVRVRAHERYGAAAVAALVALACAALVILTTLSRGYSRRVTMLNEGLRAIDYIRIDVSSLGREGAVAYTTKDPQHEAARSRIEADLLTRMGAAEVAVRDPQQMALLERARRQATHFLTMRDQMVARGASAKELLLTSAPSNQDTLNTLYEASRLGFGAVSTAEAKLARWELVETVLGVSIAVLVLGGFVAVMVGLHGRVFAPLLALGDGIDRLASGDRAVRVVPTGSPELQQTASSFNDMAERLERQTQELFTFLAGVAHDLRNPLASMRLGVQRLESDRPPSSEEKKRKTLEMVGRQVTRLERMVGDFLDASRIEGGYLELQLKPCDLREVAREAVDLYAASSPTHKLVFSVPDQLVEVLCDEERIAQVLNNLVSNAIKYSPRGGDVVVLIEEQHGEAIASVRDWGIGIVPAEQPLVFEPFRRTGASRETAPGVGLGLSVARRIVEAHHGHIDFESTPGVGSTFRVHLPHAPSTT
jgi:two-component system, OmpR family, sensor histidine kinase MtrB